MARKSFSEDDCIKVLLWCGRHCCLCGKAAGVGIEVAHLPGKDSSTDMDDAVPLCFDCHAAIGHYNRMHPRGRRYRPEEIKARRNQVYDEQTSHLVPPVACYLTQKHSALPDVGFRIDNLGDRHPVKAQIKLILGQGASNRQPVPSKHYNGEHAWNLNPRQGFYGHFPLPSDIGIDSGGERIRAKVHIALTDIYGRKHELLPVGYIHGLRPGDDWYAEPSMEELCIPD